ncbi:MAG: class I SAM-dependent methyltransferase [Anaerolineae bacterium]|nr:class I SAM-dependent methyltransferase [Anaerolineae bacterium]
MSDTNTAVGIIHPKREKAIQRRHPWIFSGAIMRAEGDPQDGAIVELRSTSGEFLARGYWNSQSAIRVRVLTWDEDEAVDTAFWRRKLQWAIAARHVENRIHAQGAANAYRLVNAESDGIPGLIVDRYGDWLVIQALTLGVDGRKNEFVNLLVELLNPKGIYERSDVDVRPKEGLSAQAGLLYGEEPPELIEIDESGRRFLVDVRAGHKTGYYLDQRENRVIVGEWFRDDEEAHQRVVVNAFAYTGGFAVYALEGLAQRVINVDSSADALALAKRNVALNGFDTPDDDFVQGDVFEVLRYYRDSRQQFDMIILDPPKFAKSARQVDRAARGYEDINLLAFRLLKPGGVLATFSCSGTVSADLFQKIVFGALIDAGREAQIIRRLTQSPDHPVALTFPEGSYLKGLLCRVW